MKLKIKLIGFIVDIISLRPFMCMKVQNYSLSHTYAWEFLMKPSLPLSKAHHRIYYLEFYDWKINTNIHSTHIWWNKTVTDLLHFSAHFSLVLSNFYVIRFLQFLSFLLSLCHEMAFDCNMYVLIRKKLALCYFLRVSEQWTSKKSEKGSRH